MDDDENDLEGLFEEYENGNEENVDDNNDGNNNSAHPTENAVKVAAPRRAVKNPRLKFNADRLCGERGIPVVMKHFEGVKFKGKGHEVEDLNKLLSTLEHWCHRLYPSMKFEDCLRQIEKLGKKRPVQTCLRKIRMDMPILNDDFVHDEPEDNENQQDLEIPPQEAFDRLISEIQGNSNAQLASTPLPVKTSAPEQRLGSFSSTLTNEQRKRMEYNKILATERRKAKFLAMKSSTGGSEDLFSVESAPVAQNMEESNSMHEDILHNSTSLLVTGTNLMPSTSNDYSEELELDDLVDLVDEDNDDELSVEKAINNSSNISSKINAQTHVQKNFIDLCNESESKDTDKNCTEIVDLEEGDDRNFIQNKVIEVINLESKSNDIETVDFESETPVIDHVQLSNQEGKKDNLANEKNSRNSNSDVELLSTPALFSTDLYTEEFETSTIDRDRTSSQQKACELLQDDVETMEVN